MWRFVIVLVGLSVGVASAAPRPPVTWRVKAVGPVKAGARFTVTLAGAIDPGWHLYALTEPDGGPVATEIALTEGDPADLLRVEQSKPKVIFDPLFNVATGFFENAAEFTLRLQAPRDAAAGMHALHVLIRYQSCNDHVCLPPHNDVVEVPVTMVR